MKILQVPVILILLFVSFIIQAQQLKENEIVVIQGERYVLHQVRTGETIFSISRDFKIERSELVENNPKITEGLDIGEILKIPYKEGANLQNIPVYQKGDPTGFNTHIIKSRKETPYFIAKKYGVTVEEIYAYNPEVKRFRKRTELRIPKWDVVEQSVENENYIVGIPEGNVEKELQEYVVSPGETLYSLSKKYGISESEIIFINPEAKNLKAGSKIYLPIKSTSEVMDSSVNMEPVNENYFEHTIESGETMWGITRKFNVTAEELTGLNPVLENAFPAGVVIKIPVKETNTAKVTAINDEAFIDHFVEKNETLYGLAQKYNVTIPEIKKYNPVLENRNPIEGEMIIIPKKPKEPEKPESLNEVIVDNEDESIPEIPESFYSVEIEIEIPESCIPKPTPLYNTPTFNVALFLPLYLEANDTLNRETEIALTDSMKIELEKTELLADTLIEQEEPKELFKKFYRNSESFLQFYEGILIAVDSMEKVGMNINLHVYDTQQNADSIRKFIYSDEFPEVDLIIGPVYQDVQNDVARIAENNQIPMVSPFASRSELIKSNNSFYQLNPSREYINAKTAEMVAEEYYNSNFIIVRTSDYEGTPEGELVSLIQEKLFNSGFMNKSNGARFTIYDFKNEGTFGLRRIMSREKENVVLIPSSEEGELSVAISNINNLADDYSITLIGTSNYQQRYPSIEVAHFHNLKLKYVYPYWVDYDNPATINFVEKFKSDFITEPNNFGIQGFDAALYFLNALKYYGKGFQNCLPYLHLDLVQGNYHFEKVSESGGYMNQGVSVISYTSDYKVLRERVKGQPRLVAEN